MFCQLFSLQNKSFLCLQHIENKGFQTVIKHRLKAIQKHIKNELRNREKNTKNAHFVLKKCTFRFRDYIKKYTKAPCVRQNRTQGASLFVIYLTIFFPSTTYIPLARPSRFFALCFTQTPSKVYTLKVVSSVTLLPLIAVDGVTVSQPLL